MYTEIASLYHLIYEDWDAAIEQQAHAFDQLFKRLLGAQRLKVLDVSCGIGTQAIGLAALSHHVTASDLSEGAVQRARREAQTRGLAIAFTVADMRDCAEVHQGGFDVVLSADNSIPHLAGDAEIYKALTGFYESLRPGGVAVVGIRDYSRPGERGSSPQLLPHGFRRQGEDRYFVFQIRDWDDVGYDVSMYFLREARDGRPAQVTSGNSRYYAIDVSRMVELFRQAGFEDVSRMDDVIYQPIIVGRRPMGAITEPENRSTSPGKARRAT